MPLVIHDLKKCFGEKVIFDGFSYSFSKNGIFVLTGDSGRGKTTLLRIISGLDKEFDGQVVAKKSAYAFQEYRLFPTLNALENITKILYEHPDASQTDEARNVLLAFGFSQEDTLLYPAALSGGMKQRVSLCRALLAKKDILLLDEPFKELDGTLRKTLRTLLKKQAEQRLVIMTAHSLDALEDLDYTVVPL